MTKRSRVELREENIRREKKSKLTRQEASSSRDGAPDSGTDSRGFDVFLNFRGPDSRHTVADILYNTLIDAGFRVFLDDEGIRKGEVIEGELFRAITNSRIYIPIFSKDYASSKWCLLELAKMTDCWECSSGQEKKVILPIFYDVSVSEDVKLRSQVYTSALQKHKEELGEVVVKPWEYALKEVAKIKGWNLQDHGLYKLTNLIKERISSVINTNGAISDVRDHLVGIRDQMEDIMQLLQDGAPNVRFIVIHGMGGIGKTTLANAIFQNISSSFQGSCILKDIRRYSSDDHDMVELQEKLLSHTLSLKFIKVSDPNDGIRQISQRLRNQKVLIVLDDVDKWDHLRKLAGKSDWFGPKSRIIVTTRDVGFLLNKDDKEYCFHEMREMDCDHALKLFCRHAFDSDCPPAEYHDISLKIVATTGRLPLALEVIGSSLYGQDKETWEFILDKLKEAPDKDVQKKLMISYQALKYEEKQIFLDIACFFNDEKITDPIYFWEACKFYPKGAIKVLERRSLIKVNKHNERLWMHDQLRDLGRAIAQPKTQDHENNFSSKPSRLWSPKGALDIVQEKEVAESIVAIELGYLDGDYCFVREEFEKATKLKFLQLQGGNFQGDFKNVFRQLRWLSWKICPLKIEATNLSFTSLVVIKLSRSKITEDWNGWDAIMVAKELKVLHLSHCNCPKKMPDFSSLSGLERLIFKNCSGLEELDSSINKLKHLDYLEISDTFTLKTARLHLLPASLGDLKSLKTLKLSNAGLAKLPDFIGNLKQLEILDISSCLVKLLPESIGRLESLNELDLSGTKITQLPESIGNLKRLKVINLNTTSIKMLSESIGRLESLNELDLSCTNITQLPESIRNLKRLKVIRLDFTALKEFPKALEELENLEELYACYCRDMHGELPEEIGRLSHLRILDLNWSAIIRVPASIEQLYQLQKLCLELWEPKELPRLPSSLTDLKVNFTTAETPRFPDLSYMTNLVSLRLGHRSPSSKLEKLELALEDLICPPIDLSSLCRLRTLEIACTNPRFLTHLPSSLERLELEDVESPIDWQVLSSLDNLSSLTLSQCQFEEVIVDSPVHCHSLEIGRCRSLVRLSNLSYLKELRRLLICGCSSLVDIQGLGELEFLRSLRIAFCRSIQRCPDLLGSMKLEQLSFDGCDSLESIPNINEKAPCQLHVEDCGDLRDFYGPYSDYVPWTEADWEDDEVESELDID